MQNLALCLIPIGDGGLKATDRDGLSDLTEAMDMTDPLRASDYSGSELGKVIDGTLIG